MSAFCADDLAGTYELNGVREVGSSLLLKVDAKFEYMFVNGAAITTVFFENERLRIDGKTLELRYWNKDRAMKYTKN